MKLFRKEKIGKKMRSRYEVNGSEKELSRKIFSLKGMDVIEAIVKLEPEEMMPHEEIKVRNKDEFDKTTKGKKISSVKFMGRYKGHDLRVLIDYGLSLLNIISDNEKTNEEMKDALN